jgi:nitrite reductase (NO-forming)
MKKNVYRALSGSLVAVLAAFVLAWPGANQALACDACNLGFLNRLAQDEPDSLFARDVLAAARNQQGLPIRGISNLQQRSEQMLFSTPPEQVQTLSATQDAPPARDPNAPFDLQEILRRDASLSIPPTSYVDQSVEADTRVEITLSEGSTYIGNGVVYEGFLIDGMIPGPTVRVKQGDIVEFVVHNTGSIPHGASLHAAYTQTSAYLGSIGAGETKSLKFKASYPGVFLYHCAPGGHAIPMHVMAGQYGMMVVEPRDQKYKLEEELGRGPDLEIYLAQHELYRSGSDGIEGIDPYVMFNGRLFRYVEEPIIARPGDYVRIYFMNVGPNLLSTFHIVGIVWDYVYWQGHPAAVLPGGQTVTAGPSDSFVIEFRVPPEEGAYTMLSHAVGSTSRGAIGLIVASKDAPGTKPPVLADGQSFTEAEMKEYTEKATRVISLFGPGSLDLERPARFTNPDETVYVDIRGNSFSPKVIEVVKGTTVTWTNEDAFTYLAGEFSGVHNVVSLSGPTQLSSPMLGHGETWSYTFNEVGEYEYICVPHPYMKAIVRVVEAPIAQVAAERSGGGTLLVVALLVSLAALGLSGGIWMRSRANAGG